jgi:hypothetical protein
MRASAHRVVLTLSLLGFVANDVSATTYTWNNTGADWGTAANWSPSGGPPTNGDVALFTPSGSSGTTVVDPSITGSQNVLSLMIAPNQIGGGWNFGGSERCQSAERDRPA